MLGSPVLWLLVVVPILAQIPLLLLLMRHIEIEEEPRRAPGDIWGETAYEDWEQAAGPPSSANRCRRCGAENEAGYRFCGTCTARL
jgi:hypothetical protein